MKWAAVLGNSANSGGMENMRQPQIDRDGDSNKDRDRQQQKSTCKNNKQLSNV